MMKACYWRFKCNFCEIKKFAVVIEEHVLDTNAGKQLS